MGKDLKRTIVFSGVNLVTGGPLSIFKDAINAFNKIKGEEFKFVVLVHSKDLFIDFSSSDICFIEKKGPKKSYLRRLWFEYVECYHLSKKLQPYLWFSLHDITPNVKSIKKAVYCHNPGPFYKVSIKEALVEPTFFFFTLFYKFLYRINIKSNDHVIVQQDWIRKYFIKEFNIKNVIVAHPNIPIPKVRNWQANITARKYTFFYPALPRVFKNFEILLEAASALEKIREDFEVLITIRGDENAYSKSLYNKYRNSATIKFIGLQSREHVIALYNTADCLVFPSKLETWGLPISEMKFFNKPILVANKEYATETVGLYEKVKFFDVNNSKQLMSYMNNLMNGSLVYDQNNFRPIEPYVKNWDELFVLLLN